MTEETNFLGRRSLRSSELGDALLVGRGGKHAEEKSESQLTRAKSKNKEYCHLFGLPDNEELVEEYNCALQRKILLQGKMYVFSCYVCFYSNVFGYITKRSLALKDVTSISKAKNVGFPNSIKIVHKGKQMFFTSFLSREDAFKLIISLWYEASPYARLSGILPANEMSSIKFSYNAGPPRDKEEDALSPSESGTPVKAHRKTLSNEDAHSLASPSPSVGSPATLEASLSGGAGRARTKRRTSELERRHSISELNIKSSEILEIPRGTDAEDKKHRRRKSSRGSSSEGINLSNVENFSPDEEDPLPLSGDNEAMDGGEDQAKSRTNIFLGTIQLERPPPVSGDMELLCEADFPICAYHFFATFLSDKSSFLKEFQVQNGDKNVNFSQWKQMDARFPGYMRNMTFSTPLGFAIGPESTHCDQTQKYCFYQYETLDKQEELALVYQTSQVNTDVPYGDYFRVCTRWDILDTSKHDKSVANDEDIEQYTDHTCKFRVHVSVPFSKSTIMKKTIVQKTKAQCTIFYEKMIVAINKHIYSLLEGSMMGSQKGVVDDEDLHSKIPAEWRQQIQLMLNLQDGENSTYNSPREAVLDPYAYPSAMTEDAGKMGKAKGRLVGLQALGAGISSLFVRGLVWAFRQMYTNFTVILLVCSLALNAVVLHSVKFGGSAMPAADHLVAEMMTGDHHDEFWRTKRAHLAREMEILEHYMELLKKQHELAK
ncbi:hypothetical protein HOP50_02g15700 [Chloropicon primus]|uniref:VASt domain-containing protein n=1 Tax=Chloropicon primus TaxID=1764295 RepID=A0A5B8MFG9_9CHLO|nr:hypothetical protein A3770_02p15790 [Chloropicon primus]UPQ98270.1 hypothetical protein HOP50_02g15700 [Chloropicon primus]|eukprot:QDZ19061.1 hypothetical protein A3770_02p15790 [Chloropicon primus]